MKLMHHSKYRYMNRSLITALFLTRTLVYGQDCECKKVNIEKIEFESTVSKYVVSTEEEYVPDTPYNTNFLNVAGQTFNTNFHPGFLTWHGFFIANIGLVSNSKEFLSPDYFSLKVQDNTWFQISSYISPEALASAMHFAGQTFSITFGCGVEEVDIKNGESEITLNLNKYYSESLKNNNNVIIAGYYVDLSKENCKTKLKIYIKPPPPNLRVGFESLVVV